MWPSDPELQAFQALSFRDKWRVNRCLARGEAPRDPRTAASAVELAEWYQRQSRFHRASMRWAPFVSVILISYPAISDVIDGDAVMAILYALALVIFASQPILNPAARPKNIARSLEASRRVAAIAS